MSLSSSACRRALDYVQLPGKITDATRLRYTPWRRPGHTRTTPARRMSGACARDTPGKRAGTLDSRPSAHVLADSDVLARFFPPIRAGRRGNLRPPAALIGPPASFERVHRRSEKSRECLGRLPARYRPEPSASPAPRLGDSVAVRGAVGARQRRIPFTPRRPRLVWSAFQRLTRRKAFSRSFFPFRTYENLNQPATSPRRSLTAPTPSPASSDMTPRRR